jgi:hypothetical protein
MPLPGQTRVQPGQTSVKHRLPPPAPEQCKSDLDEFDDVPGDHGIVGVRFKRVIMDDQGGAGYARARGSGGGVAAAGSPLSRDGA